MIKAFREMADVEGHQDWSVIMVEYMSAPVRPITLSTHR